MSQFWIEQGDATDALKLIPSGSVDALVTDPPAGISFMGREWDGAKGGRDKWIAWLAGILRECLRTMKPGAYGWVWALPRTSHWTATACEDAGFAVRDVLVHVFGTGFPKSRALLKPASEHWILVKAPGELRELRIEENRIGTSKQVPASLSKTPGTLYGNGEGIPKAEGAEEQGKGGHDPNLGRWPANFALSHSDECTDAACADDCPVKMLDGQAGMRPKAGNKTVTVSYRDDSPLNMLAGSKERKMPARLDEGTTASRFFYQAKPSTRERSAGLPEGSRNTHTTVKSIALMQHLINLIAQPGDLILDPFTGSGSTGVAALANGCRFIGIEREAEYVEIARQRVYAASQKGTPE